MAIMYKSPPTKNKEDTESTAQTRRITVGSTPRYSPIPPQTPPITLFVSERYNFFSIISSSSFSYSSQFIFFLFLSFLFPLFLLLLFLEFCSFFNNYKNIFPKIYSQKHIFKIFFWNYLLLGRLYKDPLLALPFNTYIFFF